MDVMGDDFCMAKALVVNGMSKRELFKHGRIKSGIRRDTGMGFEEFTQWQ